MRDLTREERRIVERLGDTAALHTALPQVHESDIPDFIHHVHALQNIVMARPVVEAYASAVDDD